MTSESKLPKVAADAVALLRSLTPTHYSQEESLNLRRLQTYLRGFDTTPPSAGVGRRRLPIAEIVMRAIERSGVPGTYFPRSSVYKAAGRSRGALEVSDEIDRLILLGLVMEVGSQICLTPQSILDQNGDSNEAN